MMEAILALLFGLLIGSFLNVCIYRWPNDLSVVKPRSHCIACEKMIAWYDNIPIVSYLILGGKCRYCKARISWRYPVVELATGLLFFYWIYTKGVTGLGIKMCIFSALMVGLTFSDLEERILPDEMTIGGIVIGLVFSFFVRVNDFSAMAILWMVGLPPADKYRSVAESAMGTALPALFLWGGGWLYEKVRHKEGLGFGDVKLIALVGAFLGLHDALVTLLLGSVSGAILGYSYIKLTRQDTSTYELPFGSFLAVAALVPAIWPGVF